MSSRSLLPLMLVLSACVTTPDPAPSPKATTTPSVSAFAEERGQVWASWTPAPEAPGAPALAALRAFDYWQISDPGVVEATWGRLFPVLASLRSLAPEAAGTLDVLLATLEEGARLDATFIVEDTDAPRFEGVLCRMYRTLESGATPGVSILFLRQASDSRVTRVLLWGSSGFSQGEPFTISLTLGADAKVQVRRSKGLLAMDAAPGEAVDRDGRLLFSTLTTALWKRLSYQGYNEAGFAHARDTWSVPASFPALPVRERDIFQVLSKTAFAPQMGDGFEFKR